MSLVEAGIDTDGRVFMVADTKVTWSDDEARTNHPFKNAVPKIVILGQNLGVGITGEDPETALADLVAHKSLELEELLTHLQGQVRNGFVVAALSPPRLFRVGDGLITPEDNPPRAWDGDPDAHEAFKRLELGRGMDRMSLDFKLVSGMDSLVHWRTVASVGGLSLTLLGTDDAGFRFVPRSVTVFEPHGGSSAYYARVVPGGPATRGALGIWVDGARTGLLFAEPEPQVRVKIKASNFDHFIQQAQDQGQALEWPNG
jgi:hypothetical protein